MASLHNSLVIVMEHNSQYSKHVNA